MNKIKIINFILWVISFLIKELLFLWLDMQLPYMSIFLKKIAGYWIQIRIYKTLLWVWNKLKE